MVPRPPLHSLATALALAELHEAEEKGTSWLRSPSSFGMEPGLLTPETEEEERTTIPASAAEFSQGSWLAGHSQGVWGSRGAGEGAELAVGGR